MRKHNKTHKQLLNEKKEMIERRKRNERKTMRKHNKTHKHILNENKEMIETGKRNQRKTMRKHNKAHKQILNEKVKENHNKTIKRQQKRAKKRMTDAANSMVPWGPTLNRNLCDKMYDKRKLAAQDIEKIVRDLHPVDDRDRINNIVTYLVDNFCQSPNAHNRKGGLIGMAAVAIGLGGNAYKFLSSIVPPIFRCLSDQEPRVRYYACESIYNIAKICRQRLVFSYFPEIFDILSRVRPRHHLQTIIIAIFFFIIFFFFFVLFGSPKR